MKVKFYGKRFEVPDKMVRETLPRRGAADSGVREVSALTPAPPLSLCFTIPMQLQSGKNRVLITRTGHRYPPKRFQAWRDAVMRCLPPMAGPYLGPLHLIVDYVPGDRRKRDVPGMLDALLHVLERGKCMLDDAQVKQVTWTPFPLDRQHPRCTVTLSPIARNFDEEEA